MTSIVETIWLDCDPGIDDTFAIIYAARCQSINLIGISTSPGNTTLQKTTQNALDVLYCIGREDVPVYPGSFANSKGEVELAEDFHGENGLGGVKLQRSPKTASFQNPFENIAQKILAYPSDIIWVNTGALTNLNHLLTNFPLLKGKIKKIVMMGGCIGMGNVTPAAQFNIYVDPEAFASVLRVKQNIPLVMVPLQVTHQNIANQQVFKWFTENNTCPFSQNILDMLRQYQKMYLQLEQFEFPPIHDPLTIFYVLHPKQFEVKYARIEVDTHQISYGRTNCWFYNPRNPKGNFNLIDLVAKKIKNERTKFWDQMFKIIRKIYDEKQVLQTAI